MNRFRNKNQGFVGGKVGTEKKKCFVALDLPREIVREIMRIQGELKKKNYFLGRYIDPEMMHITLNFLGMKDSEDLVLIRRRLGEIDFSSFEVNLSEIEALNEGGNPRALWVGLKGGGLWRLRQEICRVLGCEDEEFKAHLILCRINKVFDKNRFVSELKKVCVCKKKFDIEKISLMESCVGRRGRFYRVLDEVGLG